jgi:hypothetical protein
MDHKFDTDLYKVFTDSGVKILPHCRDSHVWHVWDCIGKLDGYVPELIQCETPQENRLGQGIIELRATKTELYDDVQPEYAGACSCCHLREIHFNHVGPCAYCDCGEFRKPQLII